MVYRLHKATKGLFLKALIVILIYSIVIGSIGWVLISFATNFDSESFNPKLVDFNAKTEQAEDFELCESYDLNCDWYILDDALTQESIRYQIKPDIIDDLKAIRDKLSSGEYLAIKDPNIDHAWLTETIINIEDQWSTYDTSNPSPMVRNFVPKAGRSFDSSLIVLENIRVYNYVDIDSPFLGVHVLIENNTMPNIVCEDYWINCGYSTVTNGSYQYHGSDSDKKEYINAYEAIIEPYEGSLVNPLVQGMPLSLPPNYNQICIVDSLDVTNSCESLLEMNGPEVESKFTFLSTDLTLYTGEIVLREILEGTNLNPTQNNESLVVSHFIHPSKHKFRSLFPVGGEESILSPLIKEDREFEIVPDVYFDSEAFPAIIEDAEVDPNPKIAINIYDPEISLLFVILEISEAKDILQVLPKVISNPNEIFKNLFDGRLTLIFFISIGLIALNIVIAVLVIILGLWRRLGGRLSPRFALILRGRLGSMLEATQFFEFGGQWYLESVVVQDYDFTRARGIVREMVNERWRDTFFFPAALSAALALLLVALSSDPLIFFSIIVFASFTPLLLSVWTPFVWTLEDSGLKRADWEMKTGELLTIQRISIIIRDGFNKLVGFGAIFGIGTAGAAAARSQSGLTGIQAFQSSLQGLLSLNYNFLFSAFFWTLGIFFVVTAICVPGVYLSCMSYLNSGSHLDSVKTLRSKLQEKEIFLGTTQQAMQAFQKDHTVYYDSAKGEDQFFEE
ncbi:MAG: hypothetical protein ACXAC7_17115 [Candidatus Hodarchaeales archaeon]|jgi:hypothetical protein